MKPQGIPLVLLLATMVAFGLLGFSPRADRFTWCMENLPVIIGIPVLALTHRRFPLTNLLYGLIALHALVLMVGGHWTYAEVPAGHWVKDWLHWTRNPYDRLGHFFQGFVPILIFREVLLRKGVLQPGRWSAFVLVLMVLGLSAAYELVEWQTAVWTGSSADAFLGTQGDPWDTQWDMACALLGGCSALLVCSRPQNRAISSMLNSALVERLG